jgi:hypothetical protein
MARIRGEGGGKVGRWERQEAAVLGSWFLVLGWEGRRPRAPCLVLCAWCLVGRGGGRGPPVLGAWFFVLGWEGKRLGKPRPPTKAGEKAASSRSTPKRAGRAKKRAALAGGPSVLNPIVVWFELRVLRELRGESYSISTFRNWRGSEAAGMAMLTLMALTSPAPDWVSLAK